MIEDISCKYCNTPIGRIDLLDNCSQYMSLSYICTSCNHLVNHRLSIGVVSIDI